MIVDREDSFESMFTKYDGACGVQSTGRRGVAGQEEFDARRYRQRKKAEGRN